MEEPTNYRESFLILAENSLISKNLAEKMKNWAGLRNLITHIYEKVDDSRIYDILQSDINDIMEFIKAIYELDEI